MFRSVAGLEESVLDAKAVGNDRVGFGVLETEQGRLPLVALDVRGQISGVIFRLTVRQVFRNVLPDALEAEYIFPLPDRAAVNAFCLKVADRVVTADLKERSQAREEYEKAIAAGNRAAIAEEDRSGTFSLRVGNIPPGEQVEVELTLIGPLDVVDGAAEFRFPLVVAPRYVSGTLLDGTPVGSGWSGDTDEVPDASRVTPPILLPGFPNPVRFSLEVEIDAPARLEDGTTWSAGIRSSLHSVIIQEHPRFTVRLQPDERLNRDFVLRIPLCGAALRSHLLFCPASDAEAGVFALTVVPPASAAQERAPSDIVILLDRSGSMEGWKMVAARRAAGRIIETLTDRDRFTVLAFDNDIEFPPHAQGRLLPGSGHRRWQAFEWLDTIEARGGTELAAALKDAVRLLAESESDRQRVVLLITDGQIAGEDSALRQFKESSRQALPRMHTLGIDQAVNAGFLRRLANLSGGTCDLVENEEQLEAACRRIHRCIGNAVLKDLHWEPAGDGAAIESVVPFPVPDLFADRPVTIFGRHRWGSDPRSLAVGGSLADNSVWSETVVGESADRETLLSMWGRAKVRQLEDQYAAGEAGGRDDLPREIVSVSLAARVLSRFTAFVAVDRDEVVNPGGQLHHIVQPVDAPADACMVAMTRWRPEFHGGVMLSTNICGLQFDRSIYFEQALPPPIPEPKRDLARLLRAIRESAKRLLSGAESKKQRQLERLLKLLAEVLAELQCQGRGEATAVERLLDRGREHLASLRGHGNALPNGDTLENFVAAVRFIAGAIGRP